MNIEQRIGRFVTQTLENKDVDIDKKLKAAALWVKMKAVAADRKAAEKGSGSQPQHYEPQNPKLAALVGELEKKESLPDGNSASPLAPTNVSENTGKTLLQELSA